MKAKLILIVAAGVLLGALALAPPAEAGHLDWSFGVGFHVGGLGFSIGYAPVGYAGYPGPFFLTTSRLHYPGHVCNGACFRRGAGFYHHAACPVLGFHLRGYGYGPDHFLRSYSPWRGYGPGYGRGYTRYPYRSYGHRDHYRDRHYQDRHYRDRHYRDRHYRDRHYRDRQRRDHRADRQRGRDYRGRDGAKDRDRHYRDDSRRRGRDGERDRGRRRGARHTRPPR